ncbi:alpha/beta fold hydrolase [Cyanobium sp. NIES-981]|uniref:alpha/beta fold hydrolase n=1 Tax=Cyanobium sp. NIES-981 TaxID=1851505 RepID=UPI0007DCC725|nr:alpha/beta fold hydrolase [Cyanobium sp. NIES-981]SBO44839.1 Alpha/beta hydrolase fold:Esterase/lipase/thioesterase family [Cyanobium sp. NIES-981]
MGNPIYPSTWIRTLVWRDWRVSYLAAPSLAERPAGAVLLIHGFGACKEHWRHNVDPLRRQHSVFALDLLGFGASDKPRSTLPQEPLTPGSVRYGMDLWADQVVDFIVSQGLEAVHLVGNSIGGVVALAAVERLEQAGRPARGVMVLNCAQRALDDKRLRDQPQALRTLRPLLKAVVRQRWLTRRLFQSFATAGMIRSVLKQAYPSGQNIDDQLVGLLLAPAQQPGASEAFRGFINLFNDILAPDLLARLSTPVTLIAGVDDPWEPIQEARTWQRFACVKAFLELEGCGHCPHDEAPDATNPLLLAALSGNPQRT